MMTNVMSCASGSLISNIPYHIHSSFPIPCYSILAVAKMPSYPEPELYWTQPTQHCPNSKFPVLVYRNVLPEDLSIEAVEKALGRNQWRKGGVFKHYPTAHFHSNTHEAYAAVKGWTRWVSLLSSLLSDLGLTLRESNHSSSFDSSLLEAHADIS
ncbi:hypothetical protein CB0940_12006 [Cercospora beticola]|uniref:Uncharacterized protein n=1 Tax=Cercospora beticola TaxID=122368 RepID=A0A2G5IDG1_CERBT|nr:hypothetical protein CB0940_12006 [Cercospora beticola]PIB02897.1 hypothetical protein CB0940_12006 [Cercospora beticola]